ncbi:MAG: hypothetical protein HYX83_00505 [Chloroflexi bacterium]|nr:hypothetical protein [Chloroflexota bacterium]
MKEDDKAIIGIVTAIIGAMAIGAGLYTLIHWDWLAIVGVLIGFALGIVVYKNL